MTAVAVTYLCCPLRSDRDIPAALRGSFENSDTGAVLYVLGFHSFYTDASYRLSRVKQVQKDCDKADRGTKASWYRSVTCLFNGRLRSLAEVC